DVLKPSIFELTLYLDGALACFHLHDDGGVRDAEKLGEHNTGLAQTEIVRLQAGEDEIRLLVLDRSSKTAGNAECVQRGQVIALDMDGAGGALGGGFADGAGCALPPGE